MTPLVEEDKHGVYVISRYCIHTILHLDFIDHLLQNDRLHRPSLLPGAARCLAA